VLLLAHRAANRVLLLAHRAANRVLLLIATAGLNAGHAYKDATRAVEPCGVSAGGRGSWALVLMMLSLTGFDFKKQKIFPRMSVVYSNQVKSKATT
tara:strand:- start:8125 stop:8412 length:288 start_codon:yes stop_codon:yes gene_type:complete